MIEIIKFHDQELLGDLEGERIWIAIKPICDGIGVDSQTQYKQIRKHPILSQVHSLRYMVDAKKSQREMLCLPIDYVHGWLFSIDADRVKEQVKPTLIIYQEECYHVLYEYFFGNGRQLKIDAEREHFLLARNRELDKIVRDSLDERKTNVLEIKAIQNRRASSYHLNPIHEGAEEQLKKRKLFGQQLSIEA